MFNNQIVPPDEKIKIEEINAAVGHVIHMVGLIAHYLGVKLPFIVVNKGSKSYAIESMPDISIGFDNQLFITLINFRIISYIHMRILANF